MEELKEKGAFSNPYVMQMDKFADSLVHLSRTFFTLEGNIFKRGTGNNVFQSDGAGMRKL